MTDKKITYCNRAYSDNWYKMLRRQNTKYFSILQAIIDEIVQNDGGDITKQDLYRRRPDIMEDVANLGFDIIPSRGQMLKHNGNGIRHAKFTPSKSIAVIWEKIGESIYITFDDHAPIRYYRAIKHLRDIKLGKPALPKPARSTGRFLRNLRIFWRLRHLKRNPKFDPGDRFYE